VTPAASQPEDRILLSDIAEWLDQGRRRRALVGGVLAALDPFGDVNTSKPETAAVADNRLVKLTDPNRPDGLWVHLEGDASKGAIRRRCPERRELGGNRNDRLTFRE
jgi:hypothetical protein